MIQTSSNAARLSARLDLDDLDNARRYSPMRAYGNAKLALILFTQQLHTRYHARGLSAAAFHPGGVASNFARNSRSVVGTLFRSPLPRLFFQPPEKGARHLVRLAAPGPDQDWESGSYYENGEPCTIKAPPVGRELWDRTVELLGLQSR